MVRLKIPKKMSSSHEWLSQTKWKRRIDRMKSSKVSIYRQVEKKKHMLQNETTDHVIISKREKTTKKQAFHFYTYPFDSFWWVSWVSNFR